MRARLFQGGRRITPEETALAYAGAAVSLNVHSGPGPGYNPGSLFVNPRTFEIAACGGFQIVDRRPLLSGLFDETELSVSEGPETLAEEALRFLGDPEERRERGRRARERVLSSHLYAHRLASILETAMERD